MAEPTCEIGDDSGGLGTTTIAVIASVAAVLALALVLFCARRFKTNTAKKTKATPTEAPVVVEPPAYPGPPEAQPYGGYYKY